MERGFHWLDTLVVLTYFFGITGYGIWLTRRIKAAIAFLEANGNLISGL